MKMSIKFILSLMIISTTNGLSSNSYEDCLMVASRFSRTVTNGPVNNIISTSGQLVKCSQLTGSSCPGTIINGVCQWEKKLSVTCIQGTPVRIRVQSNGLPSRCSAIPATVKFSEINIDFEVNFNPNVNINYPNHSPKSQSDLDKIVCNIQSQSTVPLASSFISYSTMSMSTVAGLAIDNIAILNANMAGGGDPFHPPLGSTAERVDSCLGHPQINGIYHYHMASGCILSNPTGSINPCAQNALCNSNISAYSLSSFPITARSLTLIGIAKDGHLIYGPYLSNNQVVRAGTDICNGMFYDSIGNYAYFATETFPYITGCFGPSNYPSFGPSCTRNGPSSYKMSFYATQNMNKE